MKYLFLDLKNGISGDMFLAALGGLGLDLAPFEQKLKDAGLISSLTAEFEERNGFVGRRLQIEECGEHHFENLESILEAAKNLGLPDHVWGRSRQAFIRLAEAEALVHGRPMDSVHFHEVGAVDTILDITGAFWGLNVMGIEAVYCTPLPWFSGEVDTAHGKLSLPAPATLHLLQGKPFNGNSKDFEIITPTGAALLDTLVAKFTCQPPGGTLLKHSFAYGSNEKGQPLRAFLFCDENKLSSCCGSYPSATDANIEANGEANIEASIENGEVAILESNLDHLSAEEISSAMKFILEEGALDVIYLTGVMKKGRPGGLLQVICKPCELAKIEAAFFRHTHTLGIRRRREERTILLRECGEMPLPLADKKIAVKNYVLENKKYARPEADALEDLAKETGRSVVELKRMIYGE